MDRTQKAEVISELNEKFGKAAVVVVARYQGMTVADMSKLRSQMRAVGADFKISKNRLAKRAAEGTMAKPMQDLLKGPTGYRRLRRSDCRTEGCLRIRQDERQVRHSWRRRRQPVLGRERCRGFGLAAVAQRTQGAARRHAETAGDESCQHSASTGRAACPGHRRSCQEKRRGLNTDQCLKIESIKGTHTCPNSKKSLMNSRP